VPAPARWASFDCYGTLVDWNGGIGSELARLWPAVDETELLERYHEIEPRVQLNGALPYRQVLADSLRLLAESEGLELDPAEEQTLGSALPRWPVFPEVPSELRELRERGWRIAILSNTDPDLLEASLETIGVPTDARITAADAGSYKPAPGHWETLFRREDVDRERHVHVAASPFHDIAPAGELEVPAVWINRLGETSDLPRAGELPTLSGLADLLDRIRPA
jgi:2-haloacid dehalogenase